MRDAAKKWYLDKAEYLGNRNANGIALRIAKAERKGGLQYEVNPFCI